jgi:pyruvate/2-oxoglutarate dehydrogenase complex dihydrolipoamide acyltransferase (E2) component
MTREIRLPELGDGITSAVVACWHCKVGDRVNPDEDVVEVVTDKASFNISAEMRGTIDAILVPEGQEAKVGDVLARVDM